VFKVSAFRFNTRTKTRAPLPDCGINNALIQFIPSCQDKSYANAEIKAVSNVGKLSDTACSIISCLVVGIFYAEKKQRSDKVLPFGARGSGNYASPCIISAGDTETSDSLNSFKQQVKSTRYI